MAQLLEDSLFCEEFIQQCPAAVEVLNLVAQECSAGECQMSAGAMSMEWWEYPQSTFAELQRQGSLQPPLARKAVLFSEHQAHAWVFSYFLFYIYINMKSLWWHLSSGEPAFKNYRIFVLFCFVSHYVALAGLELFLLINF